MLKKKKEENKLSAWLGITITKCVVLIWVNWPFNDMLLYVYEATENS